jgi:alpha-1,3-rhamnosyl/mannosyltransferase
MELLIMRVILSNLTAIGQKTGIGHYITELATSLRARAPQSRFDTFPGAVVTAGAGLMRSLRRRWGGRGQPNAAGQPEGKGDWATALGRKCAAWHFRAFWSWRNFDIYHEPNYIPFPCDRPTVATVHDLSVLLHPEWHPRHRVEHFARHFEAGLARCTRLLTDSEFTRQELIDIFGIAPERVRRVPLGIRADIAGQRAAGFSPAEFSPTSDTQAIRARFDLPPTYLLHVGTIEPRKNLRMLMQAYCDLPGPVRERCPLLLAGGWGWNVADVADYYHTVGRTRGIRHLGYVSDAELPALYRGARALVFPTHYEGFGLPPLEMMACGGAVIASRAGAVVETVGHQAHLVDAEDIEGWRDAMLRVITESDWRDGLAHGGTETAGRYTWQRCALGTYAVYDEALGRNLQGALAA